MSDRVVYDSAGRLQQREIDELLDMGIDYYAYCYRFDYAGSPRRLLNDILRGSKQTLKNLAIMEDETE